MICGMNQHTRRSFLKGVSGLVVGASGTAWLKGEAALAADAAATSPSVGSCRPRMAFSVCVHPVEFMENPDLGKLLVSSGIEKVWLAGYFYGQWCYDKDKTLKAKAMADASGLKTAMVNVPFGHPGNSLGEVEKLVPLTIPSHWHYRINVDGQEVRHCGCLSDAMWRDNLDALREAHRMGFREVFMDDDMRLSLGPGVIGGCFCRECVDRYRRQTGASGAGIEEIRRQVRGRIPGPELMRWLKHHGGRLTTFLNECNGIAPDLSVGIMVMYMGCEQAGIELEHLRRRLFRVGEGMFDDRSFGSVGGKLTSLASAMFHMNYADPRLAYSETTAFPPTGLSAENLGRKMAVPLMAGVGNVAIMSGIRLFPKDYWSTLSRHIRRIGQVSAGVSAEKPAGVLKLWFGPGLRSVAAGWPMIECLGMGLPTEVVTQIAPSGIYAVQSDDVPFLPEAVKADPTALIISHVPKPASVRCEWINAGTSWPSRWQAKKEIAGRLKDAPFVVGDVPVAVRWYPRAGRLLVWNVNETNQQFVIRGRGRDETAKLSAGEVAML